MHRAVRPMTLEYKGAQITFDMPGWYSDASDESIHTGEDMKVSDRALIELKQRPRRRMTAKEISAVGAEIAAMPILDPRSPQDIIDDINEL